MQTEESKIENLHIVIVMLLLLLMIVLNLYLSVPENLLEHLVMEEAVELI